MMRIESLRLYFEEKLGERINRALRSGFEQPLGCRMNPTIGVN